MVKKGEKPPQAPKRKRNPHPKKESSDSFSSSTTIEADHYKLLGLNRNASQDEVKKSYKKLVKHWHPDKHCFQEKSLAEAKCKEIIEAYQILNDPEKRKKYDDHHANIANSRKMESSFWFPPNMNDNSFGTMFGSSSRKSPGNDLVHSPLECSLEELYQGATKKMKVTRADTNASGEKTMVGEIYPVTINPGFRDGTKMTYNYKDIGFIIKEKQHSVYERHKNDLLVHRDITLLEALTGGGTLDLTRLDGTILTVPLADDAIRAPGDEMVVEGEGMPIYSQPGEKGNLRIKFNVKFPSSSLSEEQKLNLKRGLEAVSF